MGDESAKEHRALLVLADQYNWDEVLLVGEEFKGMQGTHAWFATSDEAAAYVRERPPVGTSVLIKGSRGSRMEVLLEALPK
jgi:UDP-N-acetylmuramoyl-tripeptide--D-alanyl-D-alanine ligase